MSICSVTIDHTWDCPIPTSVRPVRTQSQISRSSYDDDVTQSFYCTGLKPSYNSDPGSLLGMRYPRARGLFGASDNEVRAERGEARQAMMGTLSRIQEEEHTHSHG